MALLTLKFDQDTDNLFEILKRDFNLKNQAEVLQKGLALLEVARRAKVEGNEISVTSKGKIVKTYDLDK